MIATAEKVIMTIEKTSDEVSQAIKATTIETLPIVVLDCEANL